jgi:hypothetical protein
VSGKRVYDLTDLIVQGIWAAHLNGELSEADEVDRAAVRAAGVLRGPLPHGGELPPGKELTGGT